MTKPDQQISDGSGGKWDEADRSAALRSYAILDTPKERDFDDLAQIAAQICETPIAVVNLVDTDRQFFKAEVGLGVRETPLETSFCGKAILSEDIMIVPDATKDPRFECNPLVIGEPQLRFYAGALLTSPDGLPIGTMCVLDYIPRELSEQQIKTLRFLARQAMTQLELRRITIAQKRALELTQAAEREKTILARIVEQSTDFIGMADTSGRVFFLNNAARQMVGLSEADVSQTSVIDYFHEDDKQTILNEVMPAVIEEDYWEGELRFRNFGSGAIIPVLYNIFSLKDIIGSVVGYGTVTKDITFQKEEQQRRADITGEMAHRMKNTFAMLQAIVTQTFRTARTIEEGRDALTGRLTALAQAQDILTSNDTALATIGDIVETALAPHRSGQESFSISGPPLTLTASQALGLSLAIHELATNAAKHGALKNEKGRVEVTWKMFEGNKFRFDWAEFDGPAVAVPNRFGFGSKLVERIVAVYFEGEAKLDFEHTGVRFWLEGEITASDAPASIHSTPSRSSQRPS